MVATSEYKIQLKRPFSNPETIENGIEQLEAILKENSEKFNKFIELKLKYNFIKKDLKSLTLGDKGPIIKEIIPPILNLIDQLEDTDLAPREKQPKIETGADKFIDYAEKWAETHEWLRDNRIKFIDLVISEIHFENKTYKATNLDIMKAELLQLTECITQYFDEQPLVDYDDWLVAKFDQANFISNDFRLLSVGLKTFSNELSQRTKQTQKNAIPHHIGLIIEDYFKCTRIIQEDYRNEKLLRENNGGRPSQVSA